ncbi:MAG: flagellar basal body P-ring formation protein FlgA [Desulfamplus sp.]|nr:flagellar basal body P-ring formation protein FlgA [Desulfamplus sp.]
MKNYIYQLVIFFVALFHIIYFPSALSASNETKEIQIELRESVEVNNRKIKLGEIADIEAPEILKRQISAIDMGFSPAPGKGKILDGRQVESKIKSNRLFASNNLSSENISIFVPDKIYIERLSQQIASDDLKSIYEEYISERLGGQDFEIRDFNVRGLDTYPEGEVDISEPVSNSKELKGRVTLYVKIKVNEKDYGRVSLSGWVDIFDDVLCASRSLTRGKTIQEGDVHVKRVNVANIHGDYFNDVNDVIGKVLNRNAPANKAITPNMVEEQAVVRRGDRVKIVAARGNLKLVTIGVAKSDGRIDETIQVQNTTSGKSINAVVTGKDSVKVFY